MISTPNVERLKQMLKSEKGLRVVAAQDDAFNRKALEYGKFDVLLGIENLERKTTLRQRDSGLNPFLASLMAKNKIALGVDLNALRDLDVKKKAHLLAQISQNIKLCRKKKVKIALFGVNERRNAESLLMALGASSQQVEEARDSNAIKN